MNTIRQFVPSFASKFPSDQQLEIDVQILNSKVDFKDSVFGLDESQGTSQISIQSDIEASVRLEGQKDIMFKDAFSTHLGIDFIMNDHII